MRNGVHKIVNKVSVCKNQNVDKAMEKAFHEMRMDLWTVEIKDKVF